MVHSRTFDDVIYELYISIFDVFDVCVPQDDKKQAFWPELEHPTVCGAACRALDDAMMMVRLLDLA
jgi:hypothetical protein